MAPKRKSGLESLRLSQIPETAPQISSDVLHKDELRRIRLSGDLLDLEPPPKIQEPGSLLIRESVSSDNESTKGSRMSVRDSRADSMASYRDSRVDSRASLADPSLRNISKLSMASTTWLLDSSDTVRERAQDRADHLWTPKSLHPAMFIILATAFIMMVPFLEIMNHLSNKYRGLSAPSPGQHYLWTFGPSAVFSIFAIVWGRVEYRVKHAMPWKLMAAGTAEPSKSVLLDYISTLSIPTVVRAIKNKHFPVSISILGGILIKLLIIASTAFLSVQGTSESTNDNVNPSLMTMDMFNGTGFDPTLVGGVPAVRSLAVFATGIEYPGVFNDSPCAYQSFQMNTTDLLTNISNLSTNITAMVDSFSTSMKCEPAKTVDLATKDCGRPGEACLNRWNVTVSGSGCDAGQIVSMNVDDSKTNATQMIGAVVPFTCGAANGTENLPRVAVLTAVVGDQGQDETMSILSDTAIICSPTYSIQKTSITLNSTGQVVTFSPINASRQLAGVTHNTITAAVFNSVDSTTRQLSGSHFAQSNATAPSFTWPDSLKAFNSTLVNPFVTLIGFAQPNADLSKANELENAFSRAYSTVASQMAKDYLMSPALQSIPGTVSVNQRRLFVRKASLRIMEVCCIFLTIICIGLFKLRPVKVTPRDTSTIGGLATVLAQSPGFLSCLSGVSSTSPKQLNKYLSGLRFVSVVRGDQRNKAFSIRSTGTDYTNEEDLPMAVISGAPKVWWNPLPDIVRILILGLSFVFIAIIELLNQRSLAQDGLSEMSPVTLTPWAVCFVPAIMLTVLGGLFGIIDFYTRLIQPYEQLKKHPSPARQSILVNYLSTITVFSIKDAITRRHFGVVLTACSAFIAPFLVIFSGALFTSEAVKSYPVLNISTIGTFDAAKIAVTSQNALPVFASLVAGERAIFPAWTYDVYAFPQLSLPVNDLPKLSAKAMLGLGATVLNITVPALRATLNCSRIASEDVKVYMVPSQANATALVRRMAVPVPDGCGAPCRSDEFANTCDGTSYYYGVDAAETLPDEVGGYYFGHGSRIPTNLTSISSTNSCPQFSIVYGRNSQDGKTVDDMVALTCYPAVYEANVQAIFNIPSWTVHSVDASLAQTTQTLFPDTVDAIVDPNEALPPSPLANADFDAWFAALFLGSSSVINPSAFLGDANIANITSALDTRYGRIAAQNFNLNRRSPAPPAQPPLTGTLSAPGRLRLKQDMATTRALEALLALMFICAAGAAMLVDGRKVLPHNPCSVGVMAALMADSELVKRDVVPAGSEFCGDGELRRRGVFEGYLFSLGMWEVKGRGRRMFGINIGGAEKVE